jgi:hypothetical protein
MPLIKTLSSWVKGLNYSLFLNYMMQISELSRMPFKNSGTLIKLYPLILSNEVELVYGSSLLRNLLYVYLGTDLWDQDQA